VKAQRTDRDMHKIVNRELSIVNRRVIKPQRVSQNAIGNKQ